MVQFILGTVLYWVNIMTSSNPPLKNSRLLPQYRSLQSATAVKLGSWAHKSLLSDTQMKFSIKLSACESLSDTTKLTILIFKKVLGCLIVR